MLPPTPVLYPSTASPQSESVNILYEQWCCPETMLTKCLLTVPILTVVCVPCRSECGTRVCHECVWSRGSAHGGPERVSALEMEK